MFNNFIIVVIQILLGLGALGISVEGAHRSDLDVKEKSATEFLLSYKPHEPGIYLLNMMFGDEHVTGDCDPHIVRLQVVGITLECFVWLEKIFKLFIFGLLITLYH